MDEFAPYLHFQNTKCFQFQGVLRPITPERELCPAPLDAAEGLRSQSALAICAPRHFHDEVYAYHCALRFFIGRPAASV